MIKNKHQLSYKLNHTIKPQITKNNYSHITSKLYSSTSKSKQKPSCLKLSNQIIPKTIKKPVNKIQQLGQQKYKQAMKHVQKFKHYQQQVKKRKTQQNQIIDIQCTFKPKINTSKKYNQSSRFMTTSFTQRYINQSKQINPEKQDLIIINNKHINIKNQQKLNQTQTNNNNKTKSTQLADRLMKWGKDRDIKIKNKVIQVQVGKTISRQSSLSSKSQNKSTLQKYKSYRKLHDNKLNLTMSAVMNNRNHNISINETHMLSQTQNLTPRTQRLHVDNKMARSTMSLASNDSIERNKKFDIDRLDFGKIDENEVNEQKQTIMKRRLKLYTEIGSTQRQSINNHNNYTIGEKILLGQSNKGQGQYYLRQARANIMRNYNKTDLLIKNNKYSNAFNKQFIRSNNDHIKYQLK